MNITEFMSFDLGWFTTLPGILITAGVVVLLIALILFLVSNKKDKNNLESAAPVNGVSTDVNAVPSVENNNMVSNIPNNDNMSMPNMEVAQNVGMVNSLPETNIDNNVNVPSVNNDVIQPTNIVNNAVQPATVVMDANIPSPVVDNSSNNVVVPSVPNENNYGATPVPTNVVDFSSTPVAETPVTVEPQNESVYSAHSQNIINAEPTNVQFGNVNPTVAAVNSAAMPTMQQAPVTNSEAKPVIYGGVNPVNTITNTAEAKPVIYGGANPLENTTTLPVMNHDAYNISSNNVAPVAQPEPVVAPAPVVEQQPAASFQFTPAAEPVVAEVNNNSPVFAPVDNSSDSSSEIETLDF